MFGCIKIFLVRRPFFFINSNAQPVKGRVGAKVQIEKGYYGATKHKHPKSGATTRSEVSRKINGNLQHY